MPLSEESHGRMVKLMYSMYHDGVKLVVRSQQRS